MKERRQRQKDSEQNKLRLQAAAHERAAEFEAERRRQLEEQIERVKLDARAKEEQDRALNAKVDDVEKKLVLLAFSPLVDVVLVCGVKAFVGVDRV